MSENPHEIDMYAVARQFDAEGKSRRSVGNEGGSEGLQEQLEKLTKKYDELYSLSRSVWELLAEKTELTGKDLEAKLVEVKARQKLATKPKAKGCPECDRPLQRIEGKHLRCIYCGYIQDFENPFDRLL